MAVTVRKKKPDPDQIYVCFESFSGHDESGMQISCARGTRLFGRDPLVRRCPAAFVKDGERLPNTA